MPLRCLVALLFLSAGLPQAQAARPLVTDDAAVLPRGECEWVGSGEQARTQPAVARSSAASMACGLGLRSQVGAQSDSASAAGETERSASLAGKTLLWQADGDDAPAFALGWSASSTRRADTAAWRHSETAAAVLFTAPAGPGSVHLNLGNTWQREARRNVATWGAAFELAPITTARVQWAPMVEIYGDDRDSPWASVGLRLGGERLSLDMSYGRPLRGDRASTVTVGFRLGF